MVSDQPNNTRKAAADAVIAARQQYVAARLDGQVRPQRSTQRGRAGSATIAETSEGPLQALRVIETVGESEPFRIAFISECQGNAQSATEVMAAKVRWAQRAGYRVLTRDVPIQFAPYNAVIRVSEMGTEDRNRDYLAHIVD